MTGFIPSSTQSIILMIAIFFFFFLAIYLPWRKKATVTSVILISLIAIFSLQLILSSNIFYEIPFLSGMEKVPTITVYREIGLYPRSIVDDQTLYQFITSTYLHSNFLHLIFNFIGLLLLGIQLEKKIGWYRFLILYFGSGIIAGALILMISPFNAVGQSMMIPSIGASGCIFGILGGYWYLYPNDKIFFPLPLQFIKMTNKWPVSLIFLIYGGFTSFFLILGDDSNTSHIGHFGGLVGAFPIAALIRPPKKIEKVKKLKKEDLSVYAKNAKQREYLQKAYDADEDDVRNAWLDEFFLNIKCPKCKSSNMRFEEGKGICPKCGKTIRP